MRSRYSAFVVGDADHLLATWHPATRPPSLELHPEVRWTGLDVLGGTGGGLLTKAVHELHRSDGRYALVTMCCGGGMGTGTLLEAL